jgi:hypothetical protein
MYSFYTTVHARPPETTIGPTIELASPQSPAPILVATLAVPHEALSHPLGVSFETAMERMGHLERLFCEPDGSFFWGSPHDGPRWQIDGNLFDRAGRLLFVDLKGTCPPAEFDRLLSAFGWPETPLMFQLVREAVFLAEPEFRRFAAGT